MIFIYYSIVKINQRGTGPSSCLVIAGPTVKRLNEFHFYRASEVKKKLRSKK